MQTFLLEPVSNEPLIWLRVLFGLTLFVFGILQREKTLRDLRADQIHIPYELTRFLRPLPARQMRALLWLDIVVAALFAGGVALPWTAMVLLLIRTYVFLLCSARYNNHHYLFLLVIFLFCVVETRSKGSVPRWQLLIFQLQVCVVYFYGGVAKLQKDWLVRLHPLGDQLKRFEPRSGRVWQGRFVPTEWGRARVRALLRHPLTSYLFCWGGAVFDLCIGFFLMLPATRLFALIPFMLFHLFNHWFYVLGPFPYFNYASALLFLRWPLDSDVVAAAPNPDWLWFFYAYLAVQVLVPLRRYVFSVWHGGYVLWGHHQHFSWTMKIMFNLQRGFRLEVFDRRTGARIETFNLSPYVGDEALGAARFSPRSLALVLEQLEPVFAEKFGPDAGIHATMLVSTNDRDEVVLIDPTADLRGQRIRLFTSYPWQRYDVMR